MLAASAHAALRPRGSACLTTNQKAHSESVDRTAIGIGASLIAVVFCASACTSARSIAATRLSTPVSTPATAAPSTDKSSTSIASTVTLVVEVKSFGADGGPSPHQLSVLVHATRCRWWSLVPDNNAPAVDQVVHLLVPNGDSDSLATAVGRPRHVTSVTTVSGLDFNVAPDQRTFAARIC